jgi:excinuclease ABC subunit C
MSADDIRARLASLPTGPGVYQFISAAGDVLYIGKAVNLRNRVRHYFQGGVEKHPRLKAMTSKIDDLEVIVTDSEVEALILETTLIKQRKPRYNVDLKDDKSYPYIVITNEPYPRVFATRRVVRDGSTYLGPFTDVKSMHSSLKMIRDLYMVRSCNFTIDEESIRKKKIKVCLDYHIGKCEGPCEGLVSRERYASMIGEVEQLLRGRTAALVGRLRAEMEQASAGQRFEEAAGLRDRITALEVYHQRQKIVDLEQVDRDLVAVALRENDGCCVVFRVREGKIAGKQQFFISSVRGSSEAEVIELFLGTYYLDADDVPREVHLQVKPENEGVIAGWLSQKRGGRVDLVVPKIGEKAKLLKMCLKNASRRKNGGPRFRPLWSSWEKTSGCRRPPAGSNVSTSRTPRGPTRSVRWWCSSTVRPGKANTAPSISTPPAVRTISPPSRKPCGGGTRACWPGAVRCPT